MKNQPARLDSTYTFEEFVVGPHNRFSHAAAQAVSENLGKAYNPLFLYGGVGLGKTHLMQAVGHRVLQKNADAKALYITSEGFMTEVIEKLEKGQLKQLRERYEALDLLMVDDVQFMAASEATQEEFFHVFNALHQAGKQIIMTSDRPPKMLTTLVDRLRSRFEWGLTADIKPPNLETRVAILKKKESSISGVSLDENLRLYIAGKLKANVRELEGFLRRVQAYGQLNEQEINMPLVKEIMRDLLPPEDWDEEDRAALQEQTRATAPRPPAPPPAGKVSPKPPAVDPMEVLNATSHVAQPAGPEHHVTPAVMPGAVRLDPDAGPPTVKAPPQPPAAPGRPPNENVSKAIPVVFFYPEGREKEVTLIRHKFDEIIRKHKLKFHLDAMFALPYPLQGAPAYDKFPIQCREKNLRIAIVLGPPPDAAVGALEFQQRLHETFESHKLSLQMIPWEELNKDYRYLNLALDITLIRFKEKDAP